MCRRVHSFRRFSTQFRVNRIIQILMKLNEIFNYVWDLVGLKNAYENLPHPPPYQKSSALKKCLKSISWLINENLQNIWEKIVEGRRSLKSTREEKGKGEEDEGRIKISTDGHFIMLLLCVQKDTRRNTHGLEP